MEYTYIPTEAEIKLMILYTVKEVKMPSSYTLIDFVISSCANVNYFDLEPHITDLIETQNLREYISDGERYFSIADAGIETLEFFVGTIPGSLRALLKEKTAEINRENSLGNKLHVDYVPINENEYTVEFSLIEGGVVVLNTEFYAGPKDRAIEICRYLKNNTADFYRNVMEIIDKGLAGE